MINKGFGLVELIVAVGLFVTIATTGIATALNSFLVNRLADNQTNAAEYGIEGLDAARSIRNQAYANLTVGNHGLATGSGVWAFSGTSNVRDLYTRVVSVGSVNRNGSGDIVSSGGSLDANTMIATSSTSWSFSPTRNDNVSLKGYLTNFRKLIPWTAPAQDAVVNLAGNQDALSVATSGNYAYVVRSAGAPNFAIYDISTPSAPVALGTLNIGTTLSKIVVSGNFAYIADSTNTTELLIVDVTNKNAPVQVGSFNAAGNADALGVWAVGTTVYLVRNNATPDFLIIDASTPSAPTLLGSLTLVGNISRVWVSGNFAYVSSSNTTNELQVINVTTPTAPTLQTTVNLPGTTAAVGLEGYGNTLAVGKTDGTVVIVDVTTPSAPVVTATYAGQGGSVLDIAMSSQLGIAFLATTAPGFDLQDLDVNDTAAPLLLGSLAFANNISGVAYNSTLNEVVIASTNNAGELVTVRVQ